VSAVPDASRPFLVGLDVLVLDALRYEPHPSHLSLNEALALVEALKPRRTFLTHLSHSFDHGPTQAALPPQVVLSYDGLQVEF
jgi:phosphoribosyl 1,2-cyclic phosphate phosphodiesterase